MKLYFLKPTEWEWVFKDFSDLVSDKHYKKIKYNDWRELHKLWVNACGVVIEIQDNSVIVKVFCNNDVVHIYFYNSCDESLGAFLYENYIKEGKWLRMTYASTNTTDEEISKMIKEQLAGSTATCATCASSAVTVADIASAKKWLDESKAEVTPIEGKISSVDYYYDCYGDRHAAKSAAESAWSSTTNKVAVANFDGIYGYGVSDKMDTKADIADVERQINEAITKHENADKIFMDKKENENMKGFNFDFGPCTGDQVRMSMYGLAVKNAAGTYVSYNPKSKEIVDVDILNFDGGKYMYKIPVALKDIALGDIIIHNRKPMFVVAFSTDGTNTLTCIDVCAGEQKTVIPTVNMFGFNFVTKIVSLFNALGDNAPTPEAPFGNMLPLILLSGDNKDIDPMVFLMMSQTTGGTNIFANPMMLYFMMKDGKGGKDIDPLMLMLMGQSHTCDCHKDAAATEAPTV